MGRRLRESMSRARYRIVSGEQSDLHDEPHVEGRRITVLFIRERVEGAGLDPETVAEQHDLDLAEIYQALAYYHDHPEEMQAVERRREQTLDRHEEDLVGPEDVE